MTNVGMKTIRGLEFYMFQLFATSLRIDESLPKREAQENVRLHEGRPLTFVAQDPQLLDEWIDALIDCGCEEWRDPVTRKDKDGELSTNQEYQLRSPLDSSTLEAFQGTSFDEASVLQNARAEKLVRDKQQAKLDKKLEKKNKKEKKKSKKKSKSDKGSAEAPESAAPLSVAEASLQDAAATRQRLLEAKARKLEEKKAKKKGKGK